MATHSIAFYSSLLSDAWRPPSTQYTHSTSFNPVSVRPKPLIVPPHECGACLRVACRQGRRERLRARSWRASFRCDRDRDDGGQDAEGEGAEQHRLDFCRGFSDGYAGDLSGGVRLDVTGARQHHQLDHLDHLEVHLHQAGFGDATDMEELPRGDWWIFPPYYYDTTHHMMHLEVALARFFLRMCRCGDRRVGVAKRATLA